MTRVAVTRVTWNCDAHHRCKYMRKQWLTRLRAHSAVVAVTAIYLRHVAKIHRMLEAQLLGNRFWNAAFFLAKHGVAGVALLGDHLSICAHVLSIVTAEASVEIKMPDVIGMGLPVQLHLREGCSAENISAASSIALRISSAFEFDSSGYLLA